MNDKFKHTQPKIFGIGLGITGTKTLAECFRIMGYNHYRKKTLFRMDDLEAFAEKEYTHLYNKVDQFDSFEDGPWCLLYKELHQEFPNSKFILTIRKNKYAWYESIQKHISTRPEVVPVSKLIGLNLDEPKEVLLRRYESHNANVLSYFAAYPNQIITLCWEEGDDWKKLTDFLGKDIPSCPFPHKNQSTPSLINKINTLFQKIKSKLLFT